MRIPAIKVNQWLNEWDEYEYRANENQRRPEKFFYVASISASLLRRLSNVPRRGTEISDGRQQAQGPRREDIGIQRGFESKRATQIREFIRGGYPWATISPRLQERYSRIKKPGWLPTSVVVNMVTINSSLPPSPDERDLIKITSSQNGIVDLVLPEDAESTNWKPHSGRYPLEIIDGQHRLLAFTEDQEVDGEFDLPVVIFVDLDISWQAYLFWTINVTPKRIGPSLGYDLYPLLRTQDWLEEPLAGIFAYREARAQALTEALWSQPESPWLDRISMLGRERGKVTQAAFVRSLSLSYLRTSSVGTRPGGLFGSPLKKDRQEVLKWSRAQQAAYLIFLWNEFEQAILETNEEWPEIVRQQTKLHHPGSTGDQDPGFAGIYSLLSTDQGVRGFLQVSNDFSCYFAVDIGFNDWTRNEQSDATDPIEVSSALLDLGTRKNITAFVKEMCRESARFDWSSAVTPELPVERRNKQALYRTGSGYREVRRQLLLHFSYDASADFKSAARAMVAALNYEQSTPSA